MRLNRYFRKEEIFPNPNITIEVGRKYHSVFLETFPEFELELRKWTNKNLARMSCESVRNFINESLLPEMYRTYTYKIIRNPSIISLSSNFWKILGYQKKE